MFGMPAGWVTAWKRSVPVEQRISGLGNSARGALRNIKDYDPHVRVMWDRKRKVVVLWRIPNPDEHPLLIADSPFGPHIDQRLYLWLTGSDTYKYRDLDDYTDKKVDGPNDKREADRQKEAFNKVDHDKLWWAMKKEKTEMDGNPRGITVSVPDTKTSGE